jgi:hypothetical protein
MIGLSEFPEAPVDAESVVEISLLPQIKTSHLS